MHNFCKVEGRTHVKSLLHLADPGLSGPWQARPWYIGLTPGPSTLEGRKQQVHWGLTRPSQMLVRQHSWYQQGHLDSAEQVKLLFGIAEASSELLPSANIEQIYIKRLREAHCFHNARHGSVRGHQASRRDYYLLLSN